MRKIIPLLALLAVGLSAQAQNFKYGKVSEEEVLEKVHPGDKDANAAVLFKEQKVKYEFNRGTGFILVTEVHERIKIYNKDGFDWATKAVQVYRNRTDREKVSGIKGVTYNMVDGKLVEEKLKNNGIFEEEVSEYWHKTTFTMPAVAEGSVIEYQYTIRSPFLTSIDQMALQYTIPINRLEASVSIPEYLGFRKHFNPRSPIVFPLIQESDPIYVRGAQGSNDLEYRQNKYILQKDSIPALKREPFIGYLQNFAATLDWEMQYTMFPNSTVENLAQDWEGVTEGIFNEGGYERALDRTGFFEDDLKEIFKGKTTPEEKALAVYQFVKKKVKWNGYYCFLPEKGTRDAYKEGLGNVGDINVLLTAMLKASGLEAYPVLVSTEDNGIVHFPTRKGFNYVITAVKLDGRQVLLDATETNAAFGELPSRARNWQGRVIFDKTTSDWINLMPEKKSSFSTILYLTFEDDLALSGKTVNVIDGLFAKSYRDKFASMNQESYLQKMEKDKGNIQINSLVVENKDSIGAKIKETYEFVLKDGVEEINDRIYLQPLLFEKLEENPFKAEVRRYPIFFDFPREAETVVNIKIPEGYVVESLPESVLVTFDDGGGSYRFQVKQNGDYLRIESMLEWTNLIYLADQFNNIKSFYNMIVEKNTEAIVLKKA